MLESQSNHRKHFCKHLLAFDRQFRVFLVFSGLHFQVCQPKPSRGLHDSFGCAKLHESGCSTALESSSSGQISALLCQRVQQRRGWAPDLLSCEQVLTAQGANVLGVA